MQASQDKWLKKLGTLANSAGSGMQINKAYTRERYQGYNSESARPAGVQPIPAAC